MSKPNTGSRSLWTNLALVLSLAGLAVVAILLIPTKERATMSVTATPAQTKTDTPLIDANAPAQTKTATFVMG